MMKNIIEIIILLSGITLFVIFAFVITIALYA